MPASALRMLSNTNKAGTISRVSNLPAACLIRQNLRHSARADGAAAFADGESLALFHGHRRNHFDLHGDVVARHHHFHSRWERDGAGDVRRAEIKLRTVI